MMDALPGAARYGTERAGRAEPEVASRTPAFGATTASAALAGFNAAQERPFATARMGLWIGGGVMSLALVAGIGVWGYKLVLREVLGVPVVHVAQGEMRVAPGDPGGAVAADQGLSVNAVAGDGAAAPPSDVLTLAPPGPDLAAEDMEVVQTMAEADEVMAGDPGTPTEASAAVADAVTDEGLQVVEVSAVASFAATPPMTSAALAASIPTDRPMTAEEVIAFADQIAAGAVPMGALAAGEVVPAVATLAPSEGAVLIAASMPGVAAALRPLARPQRAPAQGAAEATPTPVALTAEIAAGTSLVQLGAFDSPEIAAEEWDRLQGRFGEFLEGRERVVQEAESGGRTFFRLRAMGFADLADARRLCAVLAAEDAGCIPVVVR